MKDGKGRRVVQTMVCLNPDLVRELDQHVMRKGEVSRSAAIRAAIRRYLDDQASVRPST